MEFARTVRVNFDVSVAAPDDAAAVSALNALIGSVEIKPDDASTLFFEKLVATDGTPVLFQYDEDEIGPAKYAQIQDGILTVATFDVRVSAGDETLGDEDPGCYSLDMISPRLRWLVGRTVCDVQFLDLRQADGDWVDTD